jgi:hypothetical protein
VAFLIWIAVGLLVWHMLAKRWYQVHQRWLLSVAEREAGRNLAGRRGPRHLYWELVGSLRSGFGYRFLRADRDEEIELRRRESLLTWRSLRGGFYVFAVCWLGGGFSLLMLLR